MRKIIDFNELEKLYEGDSKFQQEIVTSFVQRIPDYFDCLKTSFYNKDIDNFLIYACQLRAVAKRSCVSEVHCLCTLLERQVTEEKFASATVTLQQIQKIVNRIQAEYLSYIS